MSLPPQTPTISRQDWETPADLIAAVCGLLGIGAFALDAAAEAQTAKAARFYTPVENGLVQPWPTDGWTWINPPFGDCASWVKRAHQHALRGGHAAVLVPASVGSNWWAAHVHDKADVRFLQGRVTFVGATSVYPKDVALLLFSHGHRPGYQPWRWKALRSCRP